MDVPDTVTIEVRPGTTVLIIGHRPIPGTLVERVVTPAKELHPETSGVVASYP